MKKIHLFSIATLVALVGLVAVGSSLKAYDSLPSEGTVSFEVKSMPALNFTMPMRDAGSIFRLAPENISRLITEEYLFFKNKCRTSNDFTYEGIRVNVKPEGNIFTVSFRAQGCRLTLEGVSWEELDSIIASNVRTNAL